MVGMACSGLCDGLRHTIHLCRRTPKHIGKARSCPKALRAVLRPFAEMNYRYIRAPANDHQRIKKPSTAFKGA
jgi:hypothetical protein